MGAWTRALAPIALSVSLFGCTTLKVDAPAPEVQLPEVLGRSLATTYGVGGQPATEIEVTPSADSRPPDVSSPKTKITGAFPALLDVGIGSRFQGGLRAGLLSGTFIGNITYQPIGKPAESAGEGNVGWTVYSRFGMAQGTASGNQAVTFGPGGFPWRAHAKVAISGVGSSIGYRINDQGLIYGGYAIDWYRATGDVTQDPSSDGSSAGGVYRFGQSGRASTTALGFSSGKQASLSLQGTYNHVRWTNTKDLHGFNFALYLRGAW